MIVKLKLKFNRPVLSQAQNLGLAVLDVGSLPPRGAASFPGSPWVLSAVVVTAGSCTGHRSPPLGGLLT